MSSAITGSPISAVAFRGEDEEKPEHAHCPQCVDAMVHPEDDDREPAIIFLDMDGVMINPWTYASFDENILSTINSLFPDLEDYQRCHSVLARGWNLDPSAVNYLHDLITRIERASLRPLIVLSSAWRNHATLEQFREKGFTKHRFCNYLCGKTAPRQSEVSWVEGHQFTQNARTLYQLELESRSDVIEFWLRDHGFDPERCRFIVIDDIDGEKSARFKGRFIQTMSYFLFEKKHVEEAAKALQLPNEKSWCSLL